MEEKEIQEMKMKLEELERRLKSCTCGKKRKGLQTFHDENMNTFRVCERCEILYPTERMCDELCHACDDEVQEEFEEYQQSREDAYRRAKGGC